MTTDFSEYAAAVRAAVKVHPEWRRGQAYFNTLVEVRPDIAEKVRGTVVDCFYQDRLIPGFLNVVAGLWDNEPSVVSGE